MTTVRQWSGREIRALREAQRMSIRDFARHLGVSDRTVSKWEAGAEHIHPQPVNQAALDTSLTRSDPDVQARFALFVGSTGVSPEPLNERLTPAPMPTAEQLRHPSDGKLMVLVPGGEFFAGTGNEPLSLPDFYIDVYPTTNADYERFIDATGHPPPLHWGDDRFPQKLANHPVVFVNWHDAHAYATWAGKALPTGAQWEKAARGPHGDVYPWGDQPTPAKCSVREGRIGSTTPVNRYLSGASAYDVYDLCGNVWEWCSSETTPGRFELKGGAFTSPFSRCAPATFNDADATMSDDDTGFRCVALEAS